MADENTILKIITDDVNEQAALVINQIDKEVSMTKEDQIKSFKLGLKKETDTYLEKELNELRILKVTKASGAKLKTKRDLLSLRTKMVDQLFNEVLTRLHDFVNSDKYEKFLTDKVNTLNVSDGYFLVRATDEALFKKILKELKLNNEVKIANYQIGGFCYVDSKRGEEYDLTLDNSFKQQQVWFQNNSGLTI